MCLLDVPHVSTCPCDALGCKLFHLLLDLGPGSRPNDVQRQRAAQGTRGKLRLQLAAVPCSSRERAACEESQVPSLTDTQTFGCLAQHTVAPYFLTPNHLVRLCLVLHITQPFLNNPDHFGGMRLGFGAAEMKARTGKSREREREGFKLSCAQGEERRKRLEKILAHIVEMQGAFFCASVRPV